MKLVNLRCDSCNAQMEVDLDNLMTYCPYCGRKLLIDVDHIDDVLKEKEKTKRNQDQSQENMFREQEQTKRTQIEYEYKEREDKREHRLTLIVIILPLLALLALAGWSGFQEYIEKYNHQQQNEVQISISASETENRHYGEIVEILQSDGFENITVVSVDDLILGLLAKEGEIKSVTINGHNDFSKGDWFPIDANIIIEYHTKG